jgi:hypothetical protein
MPGTNLKKSEITAFPNANSAYHLDYNHVGWANEKSETYDWNVGF